MFPVLTPNYMADLDLRNTIFRSQINLPVFPGGVLGADLFNVRLLELARINLFTLCLTSLRITICRIYHHGAKKKMARIYTGRVVASVAYKYVFRWKVVVRNGIRNAMGLVSYAFNLDASITLIPFMARPYPAGILSSCPINHFPKSVDYIFVKHGETPKYTAPLMAGESRQRPDHKGRLKWYRFLGLWRDLLDFSTNVLVNQGVHTGRTVGASEREDQLSVLGEINDERY